MKNAEIAARLKRILWSPVAVIFTSELQSIIEDLEEAEAKEQMIDTFKDANSSNYEVAIALLKMHGEGHKKNGADAWARDVLDSVSDIEAHVKALESHNSSALKELKNHLADFKDKYHQQFLRAKGTLEEVRNEGLESAIDVAISEIDSLQQEGGQKG